MRARAPPAGPPPPRARQRASRDRASGVSTVEISATAAPLAPTAASIFGRSDRNPSPSASQLAGGLDPVRARREEPDARRGPAPGDVEARAQPVAGRRGRDRQLAERRGRQLPDPLHRLEEERPFPFARLLRFQVRPVAPRAAARMGPRGAVRRGPEHSRRAALPEAAAGLDDLGVHLFAGERARDEPHAVGRPRDALPRRSEARDLDAPVHALSLSRTGRERLARLEQRQARQVQALAQQPSRERPRRPPRGLLVHAAAKRFELAVDLAVDLCPLLRRQRVEERGGELAVEARERFLDLPRFLRPLREALERAPRAFDRLPQVRPAPFQRGEPFAQRREDRARVDALFPSRNRVPRRPPPGAPRRRGPRRGSMRAS